jgi:hypothetical protein
MSNKQNCTFKDINNCKWKDNLSFSRSNVPTKTFRETGVAVDAPGFYKEYKFFEKDGLSLDDIVSAKQEENRSSIHLPRTSPTHSSKIAKYQNSIFTEAKRTKNYTREDSFAKFTNLTSTSVITGRGMTRQNLDGTGITSIKSPELPIETTFHPETHTQTEGTSNKCNFAKQCRILSELKRSPPPPPPVPQPIPTEIGLVTSGARNVLTKTKYNHRSHPWDSPPDLRYGYRSRSSSPFMMATPVSPLRDQSDVMVFYEEPLAAAARLLISELDVSNRSQKPSNGSFN